MIAEQNYPVLAANIALKRAQAYDLTGDKAKLRQRGMLLKRYPDHPAAEALFVLGRNQPKYWKQAIAQFPAHPRTLEIVRSSLRQIRQPREFGEAKPHPTRCNATAIGKHAHNQAGITSARPTGEPICGSVAAGRLGGSWLCLLGKQVYPKAGAAYGRLGHLYHRTGYGFQLGGDCKRSQPINSWCTDAKETGTALLQLANTAKTKDALIYLDQVISRFPNQAGEALVEKAEILDTLQSNKSAASA